MTNDAPPREPLGATVADRSLRVATALSAEVVVLRERLDIIERLAAERGLFHTEDISAWRSTPQNAAELKTERHSFLERVFGALRA